MPSPGAPPGTKYPLKLSIILDNIQSNEYGKGVFFTYFFYFEDDIFPETLALFLLAH